MKVKDGVSLEGLRPEILAAFDEIDRIHIKLANTEATVTSTKEGRHSATRSAHYRGDAVDLRTWAVDGDEFAAILTDDLGGDYVVIHERDHVHLHWSPLYHAG